MSQIITVPFTEAFLPHVISYIEANYLKQNRDLSKLAIVFGGHRPSLFLKRDLARVIKGPYIPPKFYTIDQWINAVVEDMHPRMQSPLDHAYAIYSLAKEYTPTILEGRDSFAQFLPWAKEILQFIEQLDLEDVPLDSLKVIAAHAQIGFNVPEDINRLLEHLSVLRAHYHQYLNDHQLTTRGYQYLKASRRVSQWTVPFEEVLFCNFFYLHRTENIVLKNLYERSKVTLFMHGDERRWPALERISKTFGTSISEGPAVIETDFKLHLYEAFDSHAQAALVKNILGSIKNLNDTVVVLPNPDSLLPLLTGLGSQLDEFNISLGYPLKRSALYALLELMIKAQHSRSNGLYYARDYLKVLQHPLIKNLKLMGDPSLVRMMIHRIEEALKGDVLTASSGVLFLDLKTLFADEVLWASLPDPQMMSAALKTIHTMIFDNFENIQTSRQLGVALSEFLDFMSEYSFLERYPLNAQIARRIAVIIEELDVCSFAEEVFDSRELFRVVQERLSSEIVAFTGSPLRGLQVLGLFETRALNFKNVIIVDVNEGSLPNLNIYERLVPREVMIKLNLDRLELEEEIQRYGFMRLISGADNVHLIYQQNTDKVRSRFVEELIWEQERRSKALGVVDVCRVAFDVSVERPQRSIPKTQAILDYLKNFTFSSSSIQTYLRNPYDFYCQYILGLREKEDLLEDPQSRHVGTFIHALLEETFKGFIGKKPVIDDQFLTYFYKIYNQRFEEFFGRSKRSDIFLMEAVLKTRLERFLSYEAKRCEEEVEKILFIERKFDQILKFGDRSVRFTYRVDRVDQTVDGKIFIIDYKTGGIDQMPKAASAVERMDLTRTNIRDCIGSFQLPLYVQYLYQHYPHTRVDAALYNLRSITLDYFLDKTPMNEVIHAMSIYHNALEKIIEEIFNPEIAFVDDPVDIK